MTENDHEIISDFVLLAEERAPNQRLYPQRGEERLAYQLRLDLFRFATAAGEINAQIPDCGHVLERSALLLPIEEISGRDDISQVPSRQTLLPKHHDPLGVRV